MVEIVDTRILSVRAVRRVGANPTIPTNFLLKTISYRFIMEHHTKNKGDLGVLKAKCDLCEKSYTILSPETEHSRFDFVIYKNLTFYKIQVKYRELNSNSGTITVTLKTSWSDKNGSHAKYYEENDFDILCIYCPNTDKCYYLDNNVIKNKNSVTLRINKPKSHYQKNMNYAENFINFPKD